MKIIIAGAGAVGSYLAKMLSNEANEITVLDSDEERLLKLSQSVDVVTLSGDTSSVDLLRRAKVGTADLFIGVAPFISQDVNIVSALIAKKLGCKTVCARIDDGQYKSYENKYIFTELGLDLMVYPEQIASSEIIQRLRFNASSESMDFANGKLRISVYRVTDLGMAQDMTVQEFSKSLAQRGIQQRVVAISRDDKTMIPRFDTRFKYNDMVFVITKKEHLSEVDFMFGNSTVKVDSVMVLGGSAIGELVANALSEEVGSVKLIESDVERCLQLSERTRDNVTVVNGDGRNTDFLVEENITDYDAFVAVTQNDEANVLACVIAKKFGVKRAIAEVENTEYIKLAEEMGVDGVINKKILTASRIFKNAMSSRVKFVKYMNGTSAEVIEFQVAPGSPITKAPLRDINFPENAIVGGVIRGNETFIAVGDTRIQDYDRVAVFALPEAVKAVNWFF